MEESENACSVCFEDYDRDKFEPRKLPCCHTYCSQCLEQMISDTGTITCPSDRSVHKLGNLGIFGLPLDSSKLKGIDRRNIQSRSESVYFSSDFVDPVSRPGTTRSVVRQPQQPAINTQTQYSQTAGYNWNYPTYGHQYQQPSVQNSTYYQGIYGANESSPYQWSYHYANPPIAVKTIQTTVTQYGGVQDLNIQTPSGNIQIRNGGTQMINIVHY